jgi:hypothetical protein
LASGYDETFEPAGGWKSLKDDPDRPVVLAGEVIRMRELPDLFADLPWAVGFLNLWSMHKKRGYPEGEHIGWINWPAWYLRLVNDLDNAESKLLRED